MLKTWWTALLDIVYPPKCPVCRQPVAAHGMWCAMCLREVLAVRPLDLLGHGVKSLDGCWTVCNYDGGLKRIIHDMKFRQAAHAGKYLSWLLSAGAVERLLPAFIFMVPVPLDRHKFAERGFNQTELIFKPWAKRHSYTWLDCLERLRPTQPQWELNKKARLANIRGAFRVIPDGSDRIKDQDILLVDDIFTTGITLGECAQALKKAGANRVYGLVLASGAQ